MTCAACGQTFLDFERPGIVRAHIDTHPVEAFPVNTDEDGNPDGYVTLTSEFVLSCNCGECEHCRSKAPA